MWVLQSRYIYIYSLTSDTEPNYITSCYTDLGAAGGWWVYCEHDDHVGIAV